MNLFELILSPFLYIIKQAFLLSYDLTGNYGLSIVLLSFVISLLLLPIFIWIEKSKKKDDVIKNKMKPLIEEVKRCYKSQERFYYIKTINRQHNFNSIRSLIPILSLLLQIPFFIAAYQFLENYEPLKGISFLFIDDLSQADGLFGIINFLPILMTIINLITVYFYTIYGDRNERKQMLVLAGVFLVLLFNLPSGLVLYWTMNNVFSFFRLFITNPEVFKNKAHRIDISPYIIAYKALYPKLKKVFVFVSSLLIMSQLYWGYRYYFDDILFRIIVAVGVSVLLTFLIGAWRVIWLRNRDRVLQVEVKSRIYFLLFFLTIYFYLSSQFYYTGENNVLVIFSLIALLPLQGINYIFNLRFLGKKRSLFHKCIAFLQKALLGYQLVVFITLIYGKEISINIFSVSVLIDNQVLSGFVLPGILYSLLSLLLYLKNRSYATSSITKWNYLIYALSVFFITGLVFFWQPLIVFASSPETFDISGISVFRYNWGLFTISLFIALAVFILLVKKYKWLLIYLSFFLVVTSFIYSLIIPIKLGSLQISQFSEQAKLAVSIEYYLLEALAFVLIFLAIRWVFTRKYYKVTTIVLVVFNLLVIGQSLYSAINTGFFYLSIAEQSNKKTKGIPFSKDKQNIVYFLADGFQGWYMNKILEEEPYLKEKFSGFTWYPNTLSKANYTHASLPSMLLGNTYTVEEINKDSLNTMKSKIINASKTFIKKARDKGFVYSSTVMHYSGVTPDYFDNYIPFWDENWKKYASKVPLGVSVNIWEKRFYENALFYSVPLFLKPKIYNNTEWLTYYQTESDSEGAKGKVKYSLEPYNFIRLLPEISTVGNLDRNFIYIHEMSLHNPWNIVDDNGEMKANVSAYENNKWFAIRFARWIDWMRKEGVYDNTKIVVVSDHGASWPDLEAEPDVESNVNFTDNNPSGIIPKHFWRLNALLMSKDFNEKGPLKSDWRLMCNSDASSIVFDENDQTKISSGNRTVNAFFTGWEGKVLLRNKLKIYRQYEVTNNMFDLNNWKRIHVKNGESVVLGEKSKDVILKPLKASVDINKERARIIDIIKKNKKWLEHETSKAIKLNISLDSMLILSADYQINKNGLSKEVERAKIIGAIRKDKKWLGSVEKQAKERGISLDSMLIRSADYVIKQKK